MRLVLYTGKAGVGKTTIAVEPLRELIAQVYREELMFRVACAQRRVALPASVARRPMESVTLETVTLRIAFAP